MISLLQNRLFYKATFAFLICGSLAAASLPAADRERATMFLPKERDIIRDFFRDQPGGLPPGLAKRSELPPGLQKQLARKGKLPPGLQKRLEPLPEELVVRLPRMPEIWSPVILGRHVILLDRRTQRILDILENVVGLIAEN